MSNQTPHFPEEEVERLLGMILEDPAVQEAGDEYTHYWMSKDGADHNNPEVAGHYRTLFNCTLLTRLQAQLLSIDLMKK